jgi:MinD-like ATPase involved in chromosome partitioning or flagellar assembly
VEVLAKLPLVPDLREGGDAGRPITVAAPDHLVSKQFAALARSIEELFTASVK